MVLSDPARNTQRFPEAFSFQAHLLIIAVTAQHEITFPVFQSGYQHVEIVFRVAVIHALVGHLIADISSLICAWIEGVIEPRLEIKVSHKCTSFLFTALG